MEQSGKHELYVAANPFAIEAREQRGRTRPVKAFVVIEDSNSQSVSPPLRAINKTTGNREKTKSN
jgi:hypothetical protein